MLLGRPSTFLQTTGTLPALPVGHTAWVVHCRHPRLGEDRPGGVHRWEGAWILQWGCWAFRHVLGRLGSRYTLTFFILGTYFLSKCVLLYSTLYARDRQLWIEREDSVFVDKRVYKWSLLVHIYIVSATQLMKGSSILKSFQQRWFQSLDLFKLILGMVCKGGFEMKTKTYLKDLFPLSKT